MPRPRCFLFLSLAAVVVGLAVGVWAVWPQEQISAITVQNAVKIKSGMTLAEVELILGGPARAEVSGSIASESKSAFNSPDGKTLFDQLRENWPVEPNLIRRQDTIRQWASDHAQIIVVFDHADRAIAVNVHPRRRVIETPFDMIRRRLRI